MTEEDKKVDDFLNELKEKFDVENLIVVGHLKGNKDVFVMYRTRDVLDLLTLMAILKDRAMVDIERMASITHEDVQILRDKLGIVSGGCGCSKNENMYM